MGGGDDAAGVVDGALVEVAQHCFVGLERDRVMDDMIDWFSGFIFIAIVIDFYQSKRCMISTS